jgi:RNA polymerase II subunit A C-terminal domain phosphatase
VTFDSNTMPSMVGRRKRKRLRSVTPLEVGAVNGDLDSLRSPLAKRKRLAAERSGSSKLKEAITADDLVVGISTPILDNLRRSVSVASNHEDEDDDMFGDDDDENQSAATDADDFLARELEEDWG